MKKPTTKRGKPTNLYLRAADLAKVRELTAFVAGKGERTSDSLIVRAAVHAATPGKAFFDAYREVASADLRFRQE
jgi:hypothetical protein